ncbi:MAG: hypothetical protein ACLPVY_26385 [Acidimicrobiia bacterium]
MSGAAAALIVLGALILIGSPIALSIPGTQPEWVGLAFESVVIGLVVELFVAVVLLHAGYYSPITAFVFTAVVTLGSAFVLRRRGRRGERAAVDLSRLREAEPALFGLITIVLVVAAVWIRRAPSYFIFQTGDMGGYVNSANILMRTARFGTEPHGFTLFLRETNLVLGRANTVAGLPALGAALLLGVIAFARAFRLHVVALVGIGFLVVVHPVTVWFSLFPVAESLYAPLLLGLVYLVVRARAHTSAVYAVMAGVVAGSLLLVRGEAMLLAPIIVVVLFASAAVDDNATVAVQRQFTVVSLVTLVASYGYDVHYVHAYFVTQLHHLLPGPSYRLAADAHLIEASVFLVIAGAVAIAAVLVATKGVTRYVRPHVVTRPRVFWWCAYAAVGAITAAALASLRISGLSNTLARWGPLLLVLFVIGVAATVHQPGKYLDATCSLLILLLIGTYLVLFARRVPEPKVQTYYLYFDRYLYSEVLPAGLVLGAIGLHVVADAASRLLRSSRTQISVAGRVAIAGVVAIVLIGLVPQISETRRATRYRLFGHSYAALASLDRITRTDGVGPVIYSGAKTRPDQWFYPNTYRAFALPLEQSFGREVFDIPASGLGRDVVYNPTQARRVFQHHNVASGYLVVLDVPGRARFADGEHTHFIGIVRYTSPTLGETRHGPATPWTFAHLEFDVYKIT